MYYRFGENRGNGFGQLQYGSKQEKSEKKESCFFPVKLKKGNEKKRTLNFKKIQSTTDKGEKMLNLQKKKWGGRKARILPIMNNKSRF